MPDKKKVLYLTRQMFCNPSVGSGLGENYDVELVFCETLDGLPNLLAAKKYDALVTCVPQRLPDNTYAHSLLILSEVRAANPGMPIIAYTAAGKEMTWRFASEESIDLVVENSGRKYRDEDASAIRMALDDIFSRGDENVRL